MSESSVSSGGVPLSVIVLTFNEERNLQACLDSVASWADEIIVVDSGSTDATIGMVQRAGARVLSHPFETHARQWAWVFEHAPIRHEWVLGLDADQQVTPELRREIERCVHRTDGGPNGYFVKRRQVFRGRWIRHGGYYPKYLLKLFRRRYVSLDSGDLVDHHFRVEGPLERIDADRADLIEDNRNEAAIAVWTAKHNRYAVLQATQEIDAVASISSTAKPSFFGSPDDRTMALKQVWMRLPLFLRPCLYVFYRYVIRAGFLDGKEGFIFHVLQAFWYRLLVDINIDEQRMARRQTANTK